MTTSLTLWDDTEIIMDQWRLAMQAQGLSKRTISERLLLIQNFLIATKTTPRNFTAADIVLFLSRDGWSISTRQSYHSILRAFALWCNLAKVRPDNPLLEVRAPKRPRSQPRPLPRNAITAIYKAANDRDTRAYIKLALYAGLRIHEIAKIRGEDVDIIGGTLTIAGKGGVLAVIPLHNELKELAKIYPPRGWWFPSPTTPSHIHRKTVYRRVKKVMSKAGYRHCAPHQLRHSYGTELVASGADLRTTQILLRHASLDTTQRYVASTTAQQIAALGALTFAI